MWFQLAFNIVVPLGAAKSQAYHVNRTRVQKGQQNLHFKCNIMREVQTDMNPITIYYQYPLLFSS